MTLQKTYKKWSDWSVGDIIIGTYVADHEDQYEKTNPVLKVIDAFTKEKNDFMGKNLVINSCGVVDSAFYSSKNPIKMGETVQIEYTGTTEMEKGKYAGKDCHTMNIDVVELDDSSEEVEL